MINVSGDKSGLVQCKELDDGRVNIFLGDCLDVMENMDDNSVDMIMFDAPFYQNRFKFNKDNKIQKYIEWIELVCKQFNRLLKDGGNICYINAPKYIYHTAGIFFKYFQYRNDIPLIRKGSFRPAYMLGFQHNLLMMFYKGDLKAKWGGLRITTTETSRPMYGMIQHIETDTEGREKITGTQKLSEST